MILHAKDDPFMWKHTVPNEVELSHSIDLELSEHGGHVGFINGSHPFNINYWLDQRIVKWLDQQRERQDESKT